MKELIYVFAPSLMTHLADEIPTIMALRKYGNDVKKAHDEFEAEVRRIVDAVGHSFTFHMHSGPYPPHSHAMALPAMALVSAVLARKG
jgi:hypothetical protein